jgi:hypothetical protein
LDGWSYFNYDRAKGGEQQREFYNTSTRMDGADGPLGRMETRCVRLIGEEEIEVQAGKFKAAHFQLMWGAPKASLAELWVAGEDKILLRYEWGEFDLECELISWKVEK